MCLIKVGQLALGLAPEPEMPEYSACVNSSKISRKKFTLYTHVKKFEAIHTNIIGDEKNVLFISQGHGTVK